MEKNPEILVRVRVSGVPSNRGAQWFWTLTRSPVVRYRGSGQLECLRGAKNEIKQTDGTKGITEETEGTKSSKLMK